MEGDLRFAHSRLITNAEEVAFFRGGDIEKKELNNRYLGLAKHMARTFRMRIFYHMLEGFFMKVFEEVLQNFLFTNNLVRMEFHWSHYDRPPYFLVPSKE